MDPSGGISSAKKVYAKVLHDLDRNYLRPTLAEAQKFVYWDEAKDRVFGKNWF